MSVRTQVALIGFPSGGKSTLLSTVTKTKSEAASYEFTTLTCVPGVIEYKGANIQLLDLPGIIEGAASGKVGDELLFSAALCFLTYVCSPPLARVAANKLSRWPARRIWYSCSWMPQTVRSRSNC